jgi:hypothetical protein
MTKTKTLDQAALDQFTGTETWHRHSFVPQITCTDGAKYVFDTYGAHWLFDEIVFSQLNSDKLRAEEFQVWKLTVHDDSTATIDVEDGNKNEVYSIAIPATDFPQPGITLWFTDRVILLPSEY